MYPIQISMRNKTHCMKSKAAIILNVKKNVRKNK